MPAKHVDPAAPSVSSTVNPSALLSSAAAPATSSPPADDATAVLLPLLQVLAGSAGSHSMLGGAGLASKARVLAKLLATAPSSQKQRTTRAACEALVDSVAESLLGPADPLADTLGGTVTMTSAEPAPVDTASASSESETIAFLKTTFGTAFKLLRPGASTKEGPSTQAALLATLDGLVVRCFTSDARLLQHWCTAVQLCPAKSFTFYIHQSLPDTSSWMQRMSPDVRVRYVRYAQLSQPGTQPAAPVESPTQEGFKELATGPVDGGTKEPVAISKVPATDAMLAHIEPAGTPPPAHVVCLVVNMDDPSLDEHDVEKVIEYAAYPARKQSSYLLRSEVCVLLAGTNAALVASDGRCGATLRRLWQSGRVAFAVPLALLMRHLSGTRSMDWGLVFPGAPQGAVAAKVPSPLAATLPPATRYPHFGALALSARLTDEVKVATHLLTIDSRWKALVNLGLRGFPRSGESAAALFLAVTRGDGLRVSFRVHWRSEVAKQALASLVAGDGKASSSLQRTGSAAGKEKLAADAATAKKKATAQQQKSLFAPHILVVPPPLLGGVPLSVADNALLILQHFEYAAIAIVAATGAVRLRLNVHNAQAPDAVGDAPAAASQSDLQTSAAATAKQLPAGKEQPGTKKEAVGSPESTPPLGREYYFHPMGDLIRLMPSLPQQQQSQSPKPAAAQGDKGQVAPRPEPKTTNNNKPSSSPTTVGKALVTQEELRANCIGLALAALDGIVDNLLHEAIPGLPAMHASLKVAAPEALEFAPACYGLPALVDATPLLYSVPTSSDFAAPVGPALGRRMVVVLGAARFAPARHFPAAAALTPLLAHYGGGPFSPSRTAPAPPGPQQPSQPREKLQEEQRQASALQTLHLRFLRSLRDFITGKSGCPAASPALESLAKATGSANASSETFAALAPFLWLLTPSHPPHHPQPPTTEEGEADPVAAASGVVLIAVPLPEAVPVQGATYREGGAWADHIAEAGATLNPSEGTQSRAPLPVHRYLPALHTPLLVALMRQAARNVMDNDPLVAEANEELLRQAIAHAERLLATESSDAGSMRFDLQSSKLKVRPSSTST